MPTGSVLLVMTMGIVFVDLIAALAGPEPSATMMSTFSLMS